MELEYVVVGVTVVGFLVLSFFGYKAAARQAAIDMARHRTAAAGNSKSKSAGRDRR